MKTTDWVFAWILLLLGCIHCAVTFLVHKTLTVEAIWFVSGGLVLIFGALLNMVRIARPEDRLPAAPARLPTCCCSLSLGSPCHGCCIAI